MLHFILFVLAVLIAISYPLLAIFIAFLAALWFFPVATVGIILLGSAVLAMAWVYYTFTEWAERVHITWSGVKLLPRTQHQGRQKRVRVKAPAQTPRQARLEPPLYGHSGRTKDQGRLVARAVRY